MVRFAYAVAQAILSLVNKGDGLFSGEKTDSIFIPSFMNSTIYVIIIKAAAVERLLPFHGY